MKTKFGCERYKCYSCENLKKCKKEKAKQYKTYRNNKKKFLDNNSKFYCIYKKERCKRKECELYEQCDMDAKDNINKWFSAFKNNEKDILKKLSEGEI